MLSCPSNEAYGHAETFREYVGLSNGEQIDGRLQHGWTAFSAGVPVGDHLDLRGVKFLVWSKKFSRYGFLFNDIVPLPQHRTHIVGAPILYLPEVPIQARRGTVLAVPAHGILDRQIPKEAWISYCKFVLEYDKTSHILIHASDTKLGYDKIAADIGLTVVTAGHIRSFDFLQRISHLISSFDCVISNCVQTICFYALYFGKYVKVCGPATRTVPTDAADEASDLAWIKENYPQFLKGTDDRSIVDLELGYKLSGPEVQRIMFPHVSF